MTCRRCCGTRSWAGRCPMCGRVSATAACSFTCWPTPSRRGGSAMASRAWVRQLHGRDRSRAQEDRLMEIIERFDGRPFPTAVGLVRRRLTGRWRRRSASLETIFCAELVATTYQHMGLLAATKAASAFDPGRFWSGDPSALVPPYRAWRRDRRARGRGPPEAAGVAGRRRRRPAATRADLGRAHGVGERVDVVDAVVAAAVDEERRRARDAALVGAAPRPR